MREFEIKFTGLIYLRIHCSSITFVVIFTIVNIVTEHKFKIAVI